MDICRIAPDGHETSLHAFLVLSGSVQSFNHWLKTHVFESPCARRWVVQALFGATMSSITASPMRKLWYSADIYPLKLSFSNQVAVAVGSVRKQQCGSGYGYGQRVG